jgi:hypothetical protein
MKSGMDVSSHMSYVLLILLKFSLHKNEAFTLLKLRKTEMKKIKKYLCTVF